MKKIAIYLLLLASCSSHKLAQESSTSRSLETSGRVLPPKDNFYIFLMAGQSNMAGRGTLEAQDSVSHPRVLMLDRNNQWVPAKEPLHYYEPGRTGLDCGLSFGKSLAELLKDNKDITIGMVPCAIGGSSIEQWLGDSTYRGVTLYSNLMNKANAAKKDGVIKAVLWHQGESNAGNGYRNFKQKLETFFTKLRTDLGTPQLPVYAGLLGSFLSRKTNPNADAVNADIQSMSGSFPKMYVINTANLPCNPDSIHFNSRGQREMGKMFANAFYNNSK